MTTRSLHIGPQRGDQVTRLEAFVDAAFAFAVTLLVISGDHIPTSVGALVEATKSIPTYAASFLLIMSLWTGHAEWSRRYGMDDATARSLSILLVFLVLIFVYPLKMVFAALFEGLSQGWLPANFSVQSWSEVPSLFIVFAVAYGSMALTMALLYFHAWRCRESLQLDAIERIECRAEMYVWALLAAVSVLSIAVAMNMGDTPPSGLWGGLPGFVFFLNNIFAPLIRRRSRAMRRAVEVGAATS